VVPAVRAADGSDTAPCPIPIPSGLATFMTFPLGCGGVGGAGLLGHAARRALTGRRHQKLVTPPLSHRVSQVSIHLEGGLMHFFRKSFGMGAESLWGLVQLHFWRMFEDRQ
jgi:hypothetical protein